MTPASPGGASLARKHQQQQPGRKKMMMMRLLVQQRRNQRLARLPPVVVTPALPLQARSRPSGFVSPLTPGSTSRLLSTRPSWLDQVRERGENGVSFSLLETSTIETLFVPALFRCVFC